MVSFQHESARADHVLGSKTQMKNPRQIYETTVALLKRENLEIEIEPYLLSCLFCAGCW
jgi:hypothetical protein